MPIYVPGKVVLKKESVAADPYYNNVSLLLHGDGANGSTTIVDNSPTPKTVTAVGNAQISTAASKFGGASILFNGSTDYLSLPKSEFVDFGTSDFTIEAWCRFSSSTDVSIMSGVGPTNGTLMLRRLSDGTLRIGRTYVAWDLTSSVLSWNTNQFYHIAATRSSGTAYLFRDGVEVASGSNTESYSFAGSGDSIWAVGASQSSSNVFSPGLFFNGYIDDLRITKGVARYTSNFTPPTAPFPDI